MPIAPAEMGRAIAVIDSAAYSSFEVDIFCASGSLPKNGYRSILHVSSGSDNGEIGSRVFSIWRYPLDQTIFIDSPVGGGAYMGRHACVPNTYSNYKIVVSPDENDDTKSLATLIIDNIAVTELAYDKVTR